MFMAATHNGISRLYETFGNGGSADTEERTLTAGRDVAHVVPAEPAALARALVAAQQQQLRADRPPGLAQLLREQPRLLPAQLLRQEQALDPEGRRSKGPAAYVFPASDPRLGPQAELLRVLQKQAVEISRATAAVHGDGAGATRRRRRGGAAAVARGRGGRLRRRGSRAQDPVRRARGSAQPPNHRRTPRADRRRASSRPAATSSAWTSRTRASPTRCSTISTGRRTIRRRGRTTTPGWTFPEGFGVQAVRVTDVKVLDVPMEPVKGDVKPRRAASTGSGTSVRDQSQRRQRADHAALPAEGRRHPDRRRAVRIGRREVQPRRRSSSRASRRRISTRPRRSRAQGACPRGGARR